MQEFYIHIRSFKDVQDFVALATVQPFSVSVGNDFQQVNGKSFSGMVSLDYQRPTFVRSECSSAQWQVFRQQAARFLT